MALAPRWPRHYKGAHQAAVIQKYEGSPKEADPWVSLFALAESVALVITTARFHDIVIGADGE